MEIINQHNHKPSIKQIISSFKSLSLGNYFYFTSLFFIAKTSFSVIEKNYKKKQKNSQIKALLLQEAKQYSFEQMIPESYAVLYYLFIKTYYSVFKNELIAFKDYRRTLLKNNRQYQYVQYCQLFHKQMKVFELEILSAMAECFNIKYEIIKTIFSKIDVNYKEIKGKYSAELEGINQPSNLEIKRLEEIIRSLHNHYLNYYGKLKEMNLNFKEEKLQLLSELYSFDQIYFEYGIESEIIEKCLYQNNLDLVEY